jgi:hypothetical protein
MAINYTGIDLDRYDKGNRFLSQDRFLANYTPRDDITFNVSPNMNTGIFGPGINPFPIIPQGGDSDEGGGSKINTGRTDPNFDYEFDALGGLNNPDNVGLSEEEQELMNQMRFGKPLTAMQVLGIGMNPIGGGIRAYFRNQKQKREAEQALSELSGEAFNARVDNITRGYGGGDDSGRPTSGPTAAGAGMGVGGGYASDYQGETTSSRDDAPAYDYAYGGRAGYSRGKLVEGIMSFFKPKRAIDYVGFRSRGDIPLEQYSKMKAPITTKIMEEIPESELKKIFRTQELGLYSETPEILKAGNLMQRFTKVVNGKRVIDYDRAEDILNVKLKGDETLDELFKIEFRTRPVERAYGGIVGMYR